MSVEYLMLVFFFDLQNLCFDQRGLMNIFRTKKIIFIFNYLTLMQKFCQLLQ